MLPDKPGRVIHHFWTKESGLTSMLVFLCTVNFLIVPLFGSNPAIRIIINILWIFILLSGIFSLSRSTLNALLFSIIPFFYVVLRFISIFNAKPFILYTDFIFGVITLITLIVMVMVRIFEPGPVTMHRIVGSIIVYILIGNFWAMIFHFMYVIFNGSFSVSFTSADFNTVHSAFLYFSFTTLTTTGFGEILPVHSFARNLVIIEQIIGVLYPVILIGRLVSLKVEKQN
jgi:hypothetical protein